MIDRKYFIRFEHLSSRGQSIFAAFFRPTAVASLWRATHAADG